MLVTANKPVKCLKMQRRSPGDCLDSVGPVGEVGTLQTLGALQNLLGLWEMVLKLIGVGWLIPSWHCPVEAWEAAEIWTGFLDDVIQYSSPLWALVSEGCFYFNATYISQLSNQRAKLTCFPGKPRRKAGQGWLYLGAQ